MIAIIDNGVYYGDVTISDNLTSYVILKKNIKVRADSCMNKGNLTHGTICAHIINEVITDLETIDINIMDCTPGAEVDNLNIALEWCLNNNIKLINLSLGTLNYHHYVEIRNPINKLLEKGVIIVSAYHNAGYKSFPACCEGVIGVKRGSQCILKNYCYGIDRSNSCLLDKYYVACHEKYIQTKDHRKIYIGVANSYSAAVITGYIAKLMKDNPRVKETDIKQAFLNCANICDNIANTSIIPDDFGESLDLPIINILNSELLLDIYKSIKKRGYYVEVLTDLECEMEILPADYYCNGTVIDKNVLLMIDYIYKPDIILLCLSKKYKLLGDVSVDMFISKFECQYIYTTENYIMKFPTKKALYNGIFDYFEADE